MEDALWSDCIPSDIRGLISSRLIVVEYFVFHAVCKKWRYTPVTPPHCPAQPEKSPCLITLCGDTRIIDFFHPVYNVMTTTSIPIPKLMDSRIRSSKGNWLLISNGSSDMFFFNPISNDITELPDLQEEYENICASWTFSCPPDSSSSDCFVVGFDYLGNPPDVCIIKVGETNWTLNSIQYVYTAEDVDNEGMLAVFLSHHEGRVEVWRYKMNGEVLEREKITSLDNKTLFVSSEGSCLKTCVAQGLGNKIYFSMFHNNKGVFYCLANHKYYSFDYLGIKAYSSSNIFNLVRPTSCIWIESKND
ncbi:hypothetical protein R3W88_023774 [Solanum pinnatisectum]|uniref:KIB1-4 beta-propeller domain-containing protein n=1 Tax=Solanum pinnatisectum TaxID=50273 RepID=A0AAV9LYG8_9SOLN|nr:hypothetical protein R3W88_023774 [Solanum pinnatisectum]